MAVKSATARWWRPWRRHRTGQQCAATDQVARILAVVEQEGQLGQRSAAFYLTGKGREAS